MNSEKDIDIQLEELAEAVASRDAFVKGVMNRIEQSSVQPRMSSVSRVKTAFLFKAGIDNMMYAAAAVAVLCSAGFEILLSNLVGANVLFSAMAIITMCINNFSYVGGLIL